MFIIDKPHTPHNTTQFITNNYIFENKQEIELNSDENEIYMGKTGGTMKGLNIIIQNCQLILKQIKILKIIIKNQYGKPNQFINKNMLFYFV